MPVHCRGSQPSRYVSAESGGGSVQLKRCHILFVLSGTQVSAAAADKSNEKVTTLRMAPPAPSSLPPAAVQKSLVKVSAGLKPVGHKCSFPAVLILRCSGDWRSFYSGDPEWMWCFQRGGPAPPPPHCPTNSQRAPSPIQPGGSTCSGSGLAVVQEPGSVPQQQIPLCPAGPGRCSLLHRVKLATSLTF